MLNDDSLCHTVGFNLLPTSTAAQPQYREQHCTSITNGAAVCYTAVSEKQSIVPGALHLAHEPVCTLTI